MLLLEWQHGTVFRIILFQPRQQLLGCAVYEQLCAPAVDVALLRDSLLACWRLIARCVDFHDAFCGRCFLPGVLHGHPGWRSMPNLGDLGETIGAWWSGAPGSVHARCAWRRAGRPGIGRCFASGPGLAKAVCWGRLQHARSACDWGPASACHLGLVHKACCRSARRGLAG